MSRQSFMREAQLMGYLRGRQRENEIAAFRTLALADAALQAIGFVAQLMGGADGAGRAEGPR